ncbi:MAG: hypothetical protein COX78_02890 [Candidatus Levybacteria bacterium CG_4_10_14_0_2_um_filter_35_8]|nr:MAG: hypothetical protein COX78_02890 [Candidatus Levybacteria bacterium CG_4_10_14_0_2_um_filter_35_8]
MKKYLVAILTLILFFTSSTSVYAKHRQVLGIQDQNVNIPPTVEGPGIFLPDSPFFFLDELKQNIRMAFVFTPEDKAKIYTSIAGERMAELRFMIAKKNLPGIRTDMEGIADNFKKAADQVEFAKMSGKNVTALAKEVNDKIKEKQNVLDELHIQSQGELEGSTKSVSDSLSIAKTKVENSLNLADLENEINDDILRDAEMEIHETSEFAGELRNTLIDMQEEASRSAKESQKNRIEVLKKIIQEKDDQAKKEQERKIELEKIDNEKLWKMQTEAVDSAREMVEQAQKTSRKFEELKVKTFD